MLSKYFEFNSWQYEKFEYFFKLHTQAPINLTRIKDKEDFYYKHILDSVYFLKFMDVDFNIGADVGTGGGFPGVILAILFPNVRFYLIDSIKKKCDFLEKFAGALQLDNIYVINNRVENIDNLKFDIIFSRGVGKVKDLLKFTKNVSHETTAYMFYKGENIKEEIDNAKNLIKKRGLIYDHLRIQEPIQRTYLYFNNNFRRLYPKGDS